MEKKKKTLANAVEPKLQDTILSAQEDVSKGKLYRTKGPNFPTTSPHNLYHRAAKKHSSPKPDVTFRCELCNREFPAFYAVKNTQRGFTIKTAKVDFNIIFNEVDDTILEEWLHPFQHFSADSEL